MDKIPAIGGPRGVFDVFAPGLFLFLNIAGGVYLLPYTDDATREQMAAISANPVLSLFVAISFGYLVGVVLRLFRTEVPDRASACFLRLYDPTARGGEREGNAFAYERFPYTRWIKRIADRQFPPVVNSFFTNIWEGRRGKQFLNFCKVVVSVADPLAAAEIYAAESLSRYVSGMFYALVAAVLTVVAVACSRFTAGVSVGAALPFIAAAYSIGIVAILANFRFIRIKEVETVFAAAFKNRGLFDLDAAGSGSAGNQIESDGDQPAAASAAIAGRIAP